MVQAYISLCDHILSNEKLRLKPRSDLPRVYFSFFPSLVLLKMFIKHREAVKGAGFVTISWYFHMW